MVLMVVLLLRPLTILVYVMALFFDMEILI